MPILEIEDYSVQIESKTIVRKIDLQIEEGQCLGIVGESGSGKTILFQSLLGLTLSKTTCTGKALFKSKEIKNHLTSLRGKEIGFIFQDPFHSLHPCLTLGKQIIESLRCFSSLSYSQAKKQAFSLLEQVEMPSPHLTFYQYPHELSGGMLQRGALAIVLANKPCLFIADEPTTALDVTLQKHIVEKLKQWQQQMSMTMVIISHDFGVIAKLCDHVAVMKDGQILEKGLTTKVLKTPQHPYTKMLLSSTMNLISKREPACLL